MILFNYNPFSMQSQAWVMKENGQRQYPIASSSLTNLANKLVDLAYAENEYSIQVSAPIAIITEIVKNISIAESEKYSNNKIIIEAI